jgi:hypothetical protein
MAKSPKSFNDLFATNVNNNNLSVFQQKTHEFRTIHRLLSELLGDNIAQNIIVSNFNDCILQLETTSSAIATHLKMRQSETLSMIRKQYNPATVTINVKVSPKSMSVKYANVPNSPSTVKEPEPVTPTTIPDSVASMFEQLATQANGPLKETFARLAKHRKPQ